MIYKPVKGQQPVPNIVYQEERKDQFYQESVSTGV